MLFNGSFASLFGALISFSSVRQVIADGKTVWDYAPDYSRDKFPPYPPLTNSDGSNITIQNMRGTRLYGWKGCAVDETKAIARAYDDLHKMVSLPEVYRNIDWNDQAAKDFFGAASGKNKIPDDRRAQIQQIFAAAEQMYSRWWSPEPPWLSWRYLWIQVGLSFPMHRAWYSEKIHKVRCSGNDGTGDPDNVCGDKKPNNGECPNPPGGQVIGGTNQLEAYSDPGEKYSRITFCNGFFNLNSLQDAIDQGKKKPQNDKNNLELWNSRARCFLHEATHLDYFMNTPDKSPDTDDLRFTYRERGGAHSVQGYGPYNCKVLRNYQWTGKSGFYTQRNADTYAYFATAKYVQKQINHYPSKPNPGTIAPTAAPRDGNGKEFETDTDIDAAGVNEDLLGTQEQPRDGQITQGFAVPGCTDKFGRSGSANTVSSGSPAGAATAVGPKCDKNTLSGIPFNVFHGSAGDVYNKFCDAVSANQKTRVTWTVDGSGNQNRPNRHLKIATSTLNFVAPPF